MNVNKKKGIELKKYDDGRKKRRNDAMILLDVYHSDLLTDDKIV